MNQSVYDGATDVGSPLAKVIMNVKGGYKQATHTRAFT